MSLPRIPGAPVLAVFVLRCASLALLRHPRIRATGPLLGDSPRHPFASRLTPASSHQLIDPCDTVPP
eukprot:3885224-Alexandrium_andersonii.AAC.1